MVQRCAAPAESPQQQLFTLVLLHCMSAPLHTPTPATCTRLESRLLPAICLVPICFPQRAARESDGGMLIARNHSSDEATVGSWVSSMEAVWGGLAALEARTEQRAAAKAAEGQQESGGGNAVPLAAAVSGAAGPAAGSSSAQQEQVRAWLGCCFHIRSAALFSRISCLLHCIAWLVRRCCCSLH